MRKCLRTMSWRKEIREQLSEKWGRTEKKMFGGISFLLKGNMVAGVLGDEIARSFCARGHSEGAWEAHTRPFDPFNIRPKEIMQGRVLIGALGAVGTSLKKWLDMGLAYAGLFPQKNGRKQMAKLRPKQGGEPDNLKKVRNIYASCA